MKRFPLHIAVIMFVLLITGVIEGHSVDFNIVSLRNNTVPYVSLVDLAEAYNIDIAYDPVMLKLTAHRGSESVAVMDQSATVTLNGIPHNIIYPAQLIQGAMFVPVKTFLSVFSNLIPGEIRWDDRHKQIDTSSVRYSIDSIRLEKYDDGMLVGFGLTESLECTEEQNGDNWLTLTFPGGTYDADRLFDGIDVDTEGLIQEVRHQQRGGVARLSFKLSDMVDTYSVTSNDEPAELLLSLRYQREVTAGGTLLPDNGETLLTPGPMLNTDLVVIDTVIIDPGHGGVWSTGGDPGAQGPGKTYEKDITLAVGLELKRIIDERGEIKAEMTRERDVYPSLEDRARIANEANGKLFISIHANASDDRRVNGMEAYFLSEAKTENAKRIAERENAVFKLEQNTSFYTGDNGTLSKIQFDMLSNVYIEESQYLCQLLLDKGVSATKQVNRGVRQGPFYVLLGTQALMPSVLFEIGYISNANEETMMKRVSYQKRIAEAIYDAIIEFKRRAERDIISDNR